MPALRSHALPLSVDDLGDTDLNGRMNAVHDHWLSLKIQQVFKVLEANWPSPTDRVYLYWEVDSDGPYLELHDDEDDYDDEQVDDHRDKMNRLDKTKDLLEDIIGNNQQILMGLDSIINHPEGLVSRAGLPAFKRKAMGESDWSARQAWLLSQKMDTKQSSDMAAPPPTTRRPSSSRL